MRDEVDESRVLMLMLRDCRSNNEIGEPTRLMPIFYLTQGGKQYVNISQYRAESRAEASVAASRQH